MTTAILIDWDSFLLGHVDRDLLNSCYETLLEVVDMAPSVQTVIDLMVGSIDRDSNELIGSAHLLFGWLQRSIDARLLNQHNSDLTISINWTQKLYLHEQHKPYLSSVLTTVLGAPKAQGGRLLNVHIASRDYLSRVTNLEHPAPNWRPLLLDAFRLDSLSGSQELSDHIGTLRHASPCLPTCANTVGEVLYVNPRLQERITPVFIKHHRA
jgi:hypothetical protein